MPTDKERREVAERLRSVEVWDDWEDGAVLCDARDVEYALELDPVDSWFTKASVDHLADLIDRQTCFDTESKDSTSFTCSVCGFSESKLTVDPFTLSFRSFKPSYRYCPNCGARLVKTGD